MAQPISTAFSAALQSGVQTVISKVEMLNSTSLAVVSTISDIDDGSVTVDVNRQTRRTFQLRLTNADYVQTASDRFPLNSVMRVYRGLRYWSDSAGTTVDEYVLLGTFMIDRVEVFVERNMSVVTIDGSDFWKKIATGGFAYGQSFASGTHVNTVISTAAVASGLTVDQLALDPLASWSSAKKQLGAPLSWEPGDSRSDFIANVAKSFGLSIYFDVSGNLVSKQVVDPDTATEVWTFGSGESSVMLGITKTQNDLKLVNHIIVTGEGSAAQTARAEIADNDPTSATYIGTIGDRVMVVSSPLVTTNEQALALAVKTYIENALIDEEIKLPTICLPHLEGDDVIRVIESQWSGTFDKYLAQRFDVPLRESRQVIETKKGRTIPT